MEGYRICTETKKWPEALKYAEQFLEIFPEHEAALGIAAMAAHSLEELEKAFLYASRKMQLRPKKILPTLEILTDAAYKQGMFLQALKYSMLYLRIRRGDGDKLCIAAFSAFQLRRYSTAIRFAREYFHAGYSYNRDISKVIVESAYELGLT